METRLRGNELTKPKREAREAGLSREKVHRPKYVLRAPDAKTLGAREKSKYLKSLIGGKGSDRPDSDFDPQQLEAGIAVEMEHTRDRETAKKIAKVHLAESGSYYTELKKMERKMEKSLTYDLDLLMEKSAMTALAQRTGRTRPSVGTPLASKPKLMERVKAAFGKHPGGTGWSPVPGGAKGGYRKMTPDGWVYWYPGMDKKGGTKEHAEKHLAQQQVEHHERQSRKYTERAVTLHRDNQHEAAKQRMAEAHKHADAAAALRKKHGLAQPIFANKSLIEKSKTSDKPPAGYHPIEHTEYAEAKKEKQMTKGKFEQIEHAVAREGTAEDPAAVAAAVCRKKGKKAIKKSGAGEGSRGGHIIGHTRKGTPIYEKHGHPIHSTFSWEEHMDAATAHNNKAWEHSSAVDSSPTVRVDRGGRYIGLGDADKKHLEEAKEHRKQANAHIDSAASIRRNLATNEKHTKKSQSEDSMHKSIFPGSTAVDAWASQFAGTPLYVGALELLKRGLDLTERREKWENTEVEYDVRDQWTGQKREAYREQRSNQRLAFRDEEADIRSEMAAMGKKLIDHRLAQAHAQKVEKAMVYYKEGMTVDTQADMEIEKSMEDGSLQVGVMPRHYAPRSMAKPYQRDNLIKGTIFPGEYRMPPDSRDNETANREATLQQTVESDQGGGQGNGGLAEWYRESYDGQTQVNIPIDHRQMFVEPAPIEVLPDDPLTVRQNRRSAYDDQASLELAYSKR